MRSDDLFGIAQAKILRPSPSVRDSVSRDGVILLDIEQGQCLSLNAVGAKIWMMLKAGDSAAMIMTQLSQEFSDVAPERLLQDYIEFTRDLEAKQLVLVDAR